MALGNINLIVGGPIIGALGGAGYGAYKKHSTGIFGTANNDPFLGYSDYMIHGAQLGGVAALSAVGLKYRAASEKIVGVTEMQQQAIKSLSKRWGG